MGKMSDPMCDASASYEEVHELLEDKPYDKGIVPRLEQYVEEQLAKGSGDIDANTALLKLYQFFPDLANVAAVRKVLILALMSLPASDFQLCLFLVSEKVQQEESIASLIGVWELLETADFSAFWEAAAKMSDVLSTPGMTDAVRAYVVTTLSITYLKINVAVLSSSLNMKTAELKNCAALVAALEGEIGTEDIVAFRVTGENHFVPVQGQAVENFNTVFSKVLYSSAVQFKMRRLKQSEREESEWRRLLCRMMQPLV